MKLPDETSREWLRHLFRVCLAADSAERDTRGIVNAAQALKAPSECFRRNAQLMGHVGQMAGILRTFGINKSVQRAARHQERCGEVVGELLDAPTERGTAVAE